MLKYLNTNHGDQGCYFQFEAILNVLVISFRSILIPMLWLYMTIINILLFRCRDQLKTSESDVYRRHILTSIVSPCIERVNP